MRVLRYSGLDAGKLDSKIDKVCDAIARGDLRSADVKKLNAHGLYRAKLDDTNRLILRFVHREGERACLALEVVHRHAYDRSRFLRGAPVDDAKIDADAPVEEPSIETVSVPYLHPAHGSFELLDKPISFDDVQDEVHRRSPPLIVIGAAGSGKTALTLLKLRRTRGDVAYVTKSSYLAEHARGLYFAHGYRDEEQNADFLSFRELLESVRVPAGRAVTFEDFRTFVAKNPQACKFTTPHQLFEEIRGVLAAHPTGPLSRDSYLALGVRQSLYAPAEREAAHAAFVKYRHWLEEASLFEPSLVAHAYLADVERRYDFLVVDEVQDLTAVELALALRTLRKPGQFLLCGDSNQIVHPNFFSWAAVKSLFWSDPALVADATSSATAVAVLDANYRNARQVTEVANRLLKLKNARFGSIDKESTALVRPATADEGSVVGLDDSDLVVRDLDAKTRRSTEVCVIVLRDEGKAEARRRFGTPLVFTVHEAKGLEYQTVILYRFLSSERRIYEEVCRGVTRDAVNVDELVFRRARDKEDKALEIYKFYVNALYVGLTRAVQRVYVVETDREHPLLQHLGVAFASDVRDVARADSSAEAWQREARKLELQGKDEQARAIRESVLKLTPVPWKVTDAEGYRALAEKAFARGSIFTKAKQTLYDYAAFHGLRPLALRLLEESDFSAARRFDQDAPTIRARLTASYRAKNPSEILWQTERHGVDLRTATNVTPLMVAAFEGNVPLVEALRARGAAVDLRDDFGRTAMHWALLRATNDAAFAHSTLAAMWELVAPVRIEVRVDGRLIALGREQGEFLFFALMVVLYGGLYRMRDFVPPGVRANDFVKSGLASFSPFVLPPNRAKQTYVNAVLARNEPGSTYGANRKLWIRTRTGYYVPNPGLAVRASAEGAEGWTPIYDALGLPLLRSLLALGVHPPHEFASR